jgi:hypothetical protein
MNDRTHRCSLSIVRSVALRKQVFTGWNANSTGLRSGEYSGRNLRLAPTSRRASSTPATPIRRSPAKACRSRRHRQRCSSLSCGLDRERRFSYQDGVLQSPRRSAARSCRQPVPSRDPSTEVVGHTADRLRPIRRESKPFTVFANGLYGRFGRKASAHDKEFSPIHWIVLGHFAGPRSGRPLARF